MTKNSSQITVHLPHDYQQAIQNLACIENISASEWVRNLIERELRTIYRQAHDMLSAVECIENHEI